MSHAAAPGIASKIRTRPMSSDTSSAIDSRLPQPSEALSSVERLREGGRERDGLIGLDRNERLSPLPDAIVAEIRDAIDSTLLTSYPSLDRLYDRLAETFELPRERLLLTAGSDAAVKALYQVYGRPGANAVMLTPSYAMYPIYARMFGLEPKEIAFDEDLSVVTGALVAAVQPGTRLVFIANPNQPTGTVLDDAVILDLVTRAADVGALVVVDEAYYPFSGHTLLPLVSDHPNLVVTRTFSKAWGLAGLRIGLVAAHPQVVANLYKVRSAYDVNAVAAACAGVLLAHPEVAEDYAAEVTAGRDLLIERARALGLEPIPSLTNFQVLRLGGRGDPATVVEALHGKGYIVKGPFGSAGLRNCIRVTLGSPELMARFADALADVLGASR